MTIQITALSLGAGVQSTTLALLAVEGVLPRPDVAIFADTGWEPAAVYRHLDRLATVLAGAGIELHKVSKGNLRQDIVDPDSRYASIPYFTLAPEGTLVRDPILDDFGDVIGHGPERPATRTEREGMGRRQCTSEYKLSPINRKVRELLGAKAPDYRTVPRGNHAEQWIGFSTDEIQRVDDKNRVLYTTKRYPLLELGMSRRDCERWLAARGWSTTKSACIGCPYHGNRQWRTLRDTCLCGHSRSDHWRGLGEPLRCAHLYNPGDDENAAHLCQCQGFTAPEWDDAVDFDAAIRKGGARGDSLNGTAFLHRSRVPLSIAPIDRVTSREWHERQGDLFDLDEDGDPDGCSPYGCRSGLPVTEVAI